MVPLSVLKTSITCSLTCRFRYFISQFTLSVPSFQNHVIALDEAAKEVIELGGEKMEKNNKSKHSKDRLNIL